MTLAIETTGLHRWFGTGSRRVDALLNVSIEVSPGEVVALLGANGAGKTTLAKVLATLLLPSQGTARLFGHDVVREAARCRRLAGVVFGGERGLYPELSGRDNLRFFGMLAGVRRAEMRRRVPAVLAQVGLVEVADRRVEQYSRGMKQRLHLAIGFLPEPRLLLLDEPTVGLDPVEAEKFREVIRQARDAGTSVLLTSHYLLDVERLADRVLLLDRGRICADLSLPEFVHRAGYVAAVTVRGAGAPPPPPAELAGGVEPAGELSTCDDGWELTLRVRRWSPEVLGQLAAWSGNAGAADIQVRPARLEDAYTQLATDRVETV